MSQILGLEKRSEPYVAEQIFDGCWVVKNAYVGEYKYWETGSRTMRTGLTQLLLKNARTHQTRT